MSPISSAYQEETNSQIPCNSFTSIVSDDDDEEDFIDEIDSNDRSIEPVDNTINGKKNKKTLGRVKIKMAYIDNKIRRYTTFSKRKTGIMKKAYELATLTGTEVMLLVASETGHVYTYATPKLQPMITSEAGKALIQTCLAKDEAIVEPVETTTLNNNDVILIDENQRKKRSNISVNAQSTDVSTGIRPIKRAKVKPTDELPLSNEIKQLDCSTSCVLIPSPSSSLQSSTCPSTATVAVPLSCFINPDSQQQHISGSPSFTIDLNSFKNNGMNIIFTPSSSSSNSSQSSPPSNIPLVLTLGHFPYQPS